MVSQSARRQYQRIYYIKECKISVELLWLWRYAQHYNDLLWKRSPAITLCNGADHDGADHDASSDSSVRGCTTQFATESGSGGP